MPLMAVSSLPPTLPVAMRLGTSSARPSGAWFIMGPLIMATLCWCAVVAAVAPVRRKCPEVCTCPADFEAQCHSAGGDINSLLVVLDPQTHDLVATGWNTRILRKFLWRTFPRLRRLVFEHNAVTRIEDDAFGDILDLQELSLSGNFIQNFPSHILAHFATLDRLFLSNNPLILPENGPFLYVSSLRWLQLDNCGLKQLPEGAFVGLLNLRVLQMRDNALEILGNALLPLKQLSVLALQGNLLIRQVFFLPPSLELLNLNGNDIGALNQGMFEGAEHLEYLFLSNNYVSLIEEGSLLYLQKLKFLDLGRNRLNNSFQTLSSPSLIELLHLENLSSFKLHENEIEILNLDIFQKIKSLKDMSFSRNKIKTIANEHWLIAEEGEKEEIPTLETLSLSENQISFLGTSLRPYMSSLLHLNLSSNRLVSFSSSRLTKGTRSTLKSLDLSHNRINPAYAKTLELDYLPDLEYLSLLDNKIESMNENTFRRLKRLKHLDISVNNFKSITPNHFRYLKDLRILNLNFLKMSEELSYWPPNLFDFVTNLEILSLEGNNIRILPSKLFEKLKHLKELNLSYNNLHVLNMDILKSSINLKILNLKYNNLKHLHCEKLHSFINVKELDLEGNSFREIPRNLSRMFPSLERLDVSKNLLETLDLDALEALEGLTTVRASHNPVPCDCGVRAAWERFGGAYNNIVEATCQEGGKGGEGASRPWSTAEGLQCDGAAAATLMAGVVVLAVLMAANGVMGAVLLCGWGRRGERCSAGAGAAADALLGRRGDERRFWRHADYSDNEKNSRVERWRGMALYYGTDSEDEEADPARAGLPFDYDALRWAKARRAQSRSSVCVHTASASAF